MRAVPVNGGHRTVLSTILVAATGFRLWGIGWGLQGSNVSQRPHPDEWAIYWLFRWFGQHESLNPCPHAGTQCFFDWGSLFPYVAYMFHTLASAWVAPLAEWVGGAHSDQQFVQFILAGRLLSAMASVATVYAASRIAARAYGEISGLVTASVVALSGLLIQLGHFSTPDSMTILLVTCALLYMVSYTSRPSVVRLCLAGTFVGLATASEYHMALLAVPLAVTWVVTERRQVSWLVISSGLALVGYVSVNAYAVIDFQSFVAATAHTLRIRTVDSQVQYGDRWLRYGSSWLYVIRYPLGFGVGFVFTVWMLIGAAWAVWRRQRVELVLLSWVLPYFVLVSVSPAKFMRYSAPLIPVLAVFAGGFGCWLLRSPRPVLRHVVAMLGGFALLYTATYDAAYASLLSSTDPRAVAARWVDTHAVPGAKLAFEERPNGLLNLPYYVRHGVGPVCFLHFRVDRLNGPQQYLLVDEYALEEHPGTASRTVAEFRRVLRTDPAYRQIMRIQNLPTFLGLRFPIDQSPHDWRYPAHDITIYYHETANRSAPFCYRNVQSATRALHTTSHRT